VGVEHVVDDGLEEALRALLEVVALEDVAAVAVDGLALAVEALRIARLTTLDSMATSSGTLSRPMRLAAAPLLNRRMRSSVSDR
jgi:hypothetical protein